MLLAKHASLGANPHGWTPLHYAAYAGHSHLIAKFIAFGANINSATDNGLTALMLASMNGHIEVVRTLLLNKADKELAMPTIAQRKTMRLLETTRLLLIYYKL